MATQTKTDTRIEASANPPAIPVTPDNFTRAETDLYFSRMVNEGGFGVIFHHREPTNIDEQTVIRMNRDTLYSAGIFDLDAGPLTISIPDAKGRFMSLQIINEDQYTFRVIYEPGEYILKRDEIGTRYVLVAIRTLVNPTIPGDIEKVHVLQDAIKAHQASPGRFEIPNWDQESQNKVREALLMLGASLPDLKNMFGTKETVNPIRFLIGSAMAFGGNPDKEATYINVTPAKNDGKTVHKLTVKDVPVDGFWSISIYNKQGYFEKNEMNVYSLNNMTAVKDDDGSITVQFGGCEKSKGNCLPIMPGWNYIVRLYRPHPEILNGKWKFPEARPVNS